MPRDRRDRLRPPMPPSPKPGPGAFRREDGYFACLGDRIAMNVRAAPPEASPVYPQLEKGREDWIDVPPVFIVGSARSGTTLLRLMLSAHPNISIASEGAYIYRL